MRYSINILMLSVLFVFLGQQALAFSNLAKASLLVVDEEGNAIEGASASVVFEKASMTGPGVDDYPVSGYTDDEGVFSARHGNDSDVIFYGAHKKGYYESNYRYNFKNKNFIGWQPWNPELKVVLRKKENPVPMYARKTDSLKVPLIGKPVGFDMVMFDWVVPYGNGKTSDFYFKIEKEVISRKNFISKLTISFSNKYDGILVFKEDRIYGSQFKLPRFAPVSGYEKLLEFKFENTPENGATDTSEKDDNFIFKIRSKEDDEGRIVSMYGKILGPIEFEPREETATLIFKYYLNPDFTRNLEFDPKQNLFRNLSSLEKVGIK